jgi:hypothetical protein
MCFLWGGVNVVRLDTVKALKCHSTWAALRRRVVTWRDLPRGLDWDANSDGGSTCYSLERNAAQMYSEFRKRVGGLKTQFGDQDIKSK